MDMGPIDVQNPVQALTDVQHFKDIVLDCGAHPCTFNGCGSIFPTAARMRKHRQCHAERAIFTCDRDDCAKSFRTKSHLDRHMKTPHVKVVKPKKMYECSFCAKSCKSKFDLRLHEAVHTGNKPLKCDVCDAAFAKKSRLNAHLKTHHSYSCLFPGCGFEAEKWSLLRKHLPIHNIKCPMCSSKFKNEESLERHVLSHKSTYKCSQCESQYAKKSSLVTHIQTVHEKATLKCTFEGCDREFSFKKSLRHHLKMHTDGVQPKNGPSITKKRTVTAAVLSGHEPTDDEKAELIEKDKEYRIGLLEKEL